MANLACDGRKETVNRDAREEGKTVRDESVRVKVVM